MDLFYAILILLSAIIISNVLSRYIPRVPVPLIQIGIGIVFAVLPVGGGIVPENELFMVIFVAPILFYDAKMVSRHELFKNMGSVLLLAFVLVFFTVAVIGNFIHWIIPVIPLAAAFALAGLLSPTDAIAVASLQGRISFPHKYMLFLEGESLVNDASGLVAFNFAVLAVITGRFSLKDASVTFLIMAFGGALIGVASALIIIRFGFWVRKLGMEDATLHVLIQVLTPFVIYILAEEFGTSGILAVVAGGIVHGAARTWTEPVTSQLKIVSESTWNVLTFTLNGLVFLILGSQIPDILSTLHISEHHEDAYILLFILAVYVALISFRFLFIMSFWSVSFGDRNDSLKERIKGSAVLSISAVRGAVTLAAALSIPLFIADGVPFPARDVIILIAAGVILCSLVVSAILLPLILPKAESAKDPNSLTEKAMINMIIQSAINAILAKTDESNEIVSHEVCVEFERLKQPMIKDIIRHEHKEIAKETMASLVRTAKEAELSALDRILAAGEIGRDMHEVIKESIISRHFYDEAVKSSTKRADKDSRLLSDVKFLRGIKVIYVFWRKKRDWERVYFADDRFKDCKQLAAQVYIRTQHAAISAVERQVGRDNHEAANTVIKSYHMMIRYFKRYMPETEKDNEEHATAHSLRMIGIQAARDEAQQMFEQGSISREHLHALRKSINVFEITMMEGK